MYAVEIPLFWIDSFQKFMPLHDELLAALVSYDVVRN